MKSTASAFQPRIGVLALQGDFAEHCARLRDLGYPVQEVRTMADAARTAGLIIPGGESTTIGKLLRQTKLSGWIAAKAARGFPIYGTCAGCILIARTVDSAYTLRLIDITVQRNAYGRQLDSFETQLRVAGKHAEHLGVRQFTGVFIRAPKITRVGPQVTTLIQYRGQAVLVQQGNILAGTFHPELSETSALHRYFGSIVKKWVRFTTRNWQTPT